jgi:hypothetical protein
MVFSAKKKKKMAKRRRRERLPGDETEAHSIEGFCRKHGISVAFYYLLRKDGLTPREVAIGHRILITKEDAAAWRAALPEKRRPDAAAVGSAG